MSDDHDQLDPAEALMREVGAQLRHVRLERGQDLEEVAQHLRIRSAYLLGIEQGDLSALPGRTYALGFLRSYADYLGFDGDDLITQIKSAVGNLTDRTRLRIRTPLPESRLPKTPILVLSLAAVAGIYTGWSYLNQGSRLAIGTVAEAPGNLRNLAGAFGDDGDGTAPQAAGASSAQPLPPAAGTDPGAEGALPALVRAAPAPAAGSSGPASPAPDRAATATGGSAPPAPDLATPAARQPTAPAAGAGSTAAPVPAIAPEPPADVARAYAMARTTPVPDLPEPSIGSAAPGSEPPAAAASSDPGTTPAAPAPDDAAPHRDQLAALPFDPAVIGPVGRTLASENGDARVVLRAVESSWVRISSPAGDYVRALTLEPNDVFLVPNRADLALWTGNAGGVEVIVDGTVLAPLGTSGAVLRGVSLEPTSLRTRLGPPVAR